MTYTPLASKRIGLPPIRTSTNCTLTVLQFRFLRSLLYNFLYYAHCSTISFPTLTALQPSSSEHPLLYNSLIVIPSTIRSPCSVHPLLYDFFIFIPSAIKSPCSVHPLLYDFLIYVLTAIKSPWSYTYYNRPMIIYVLTTLQPPCSLHCPVAPLI
jgi:hypothetical protein